MNNRRYQFLKVISICFVIAILLVITSCVSQKKYREVEEKNSELSSEMESAEKNLNSLKDSIAKLRVRYADLEKTNSDLAILKSQKESEYSSMETDYIRLTEEYKDIQSEIDYLSSLPRTEDNNAMLASKDLELRDKQEEIKNLEKQKIKAELDKAELTYYCPREVMQGEEFSLAVVISKVLEKEELKDTLTKRLQFSEIRLSENEITDFITSHTIKLGDSIRVKVDFDKENFKVIVSETRQIRKIGDELEEWNWRLKAEGLGDHQINVTIENLKKAEWIQDVPLKSFPINVKVDSRSYFYKLWEFVEENPEWPIATLILPVITFFAGEWKERKKRKKV